MTSGSAAAVITRPKLHRSAHKAPGHRAHLAPVADPRAHSRLPALPFASLYVLDDEWAAEIANRTMHGVMHIGWVQDETGGYRGRMAVLVKPNGLLGIAYMATIRPFRHLVVYPQTMRDIEREWRAQAGDPTPAHV
jgi:hypothetical protein